MTETRPAAIAGFGMLAALGQTASDPTGVDTFARYVWQAKQAVRQWLTCFDERDGPLFVVCEQVEDVTLVYADRIRFLQLKTRDKGSWSVATMCARGLDSLVRSYGSARASGLHEVSTFELWLEGATSDVAETVRFADNPRSASDGVRTKLVEHGLRPEWLDDFLQRLIVRPGQPQQSDIDAKAMWELGAVWPGRSHPELATVYQRLLEAVVAAQQNAPQPISVQAHLAAAMPHAARDLPALDEPGGAEIDSIRHQILTYAMLTALTPPRPGETVDQLLARISAGSGASLLELKMTANGASAATITRTKELRADMEVRRQLLVASRDNADTDLERLTRRVLTMAEATAAEISMSAASNPAAAARPAEAIAVRLLGRPADLAQCDPAALFEGDGHLVFGYLGHLSDLCQFPWQAP